MPYCQTCSSIVRAELGYLHQKVPDGQVKTFAKKLTNGKYFEVGINGNKVEGSIWDDGYLFELYPYYDNTSYTEQYYVTNPIDKLKTMNGVEKEATFPFALDFDIRSCKLTNTLGVIGDSDCLILDYQYQDVDVYIDGELVYDFNKPDSGHLHTVLGTNILSIPLKEEYAGKTITLEMTPLRDTKQMSIRHLYIAPPGDFLYGIYQQNVTQLVIATFLLVLGVFYLFFNAS